MVELTVFLRSPFADPVRTLRVGGMILRGRENVFAVKDEIVFRKNKEGNYEIFKKDTNQIIHIESDLSKALTKWEEIVK